MVLSIQQLPTSPQTPVVNAGVLYVSNLNLVYNTGTLLDVLPGAARNSTDTNDIILNEKVTINIEKTGINGVDVGTINGQTTYAVYVIADSSKYKKTAAILSLNTVQPTLPFGYDMYRRIGWICTNLATTPAILKFYQYGFDETRTYYYDLDPTPENVDLYEIIQDGTSTTYAELALSPIIPPIETQVFCRLLCVQSSVGDIFEFLPFNASNLKGIVSVSLGQINTFYQNCEIPCSVDSNAAAIKYRVSSGSAITVDVYGYHDYL